MAVIRSAPDPTSPRHAPNDFWKRLAWTLGPVAAFCVLGQVPLIGLNLKSLGELLAHSARSQGGLVEQVEGRMGTVRSLSIAMFGLAYIKICVGLVLLARSASTRFAARLDTGGGWAEVETWAKRFAVIATVFVSWSALHLWATPDKHGVITFFRDDGLFTVYLPNMAAIAGATVVAFLLARAISSRGLGNGLLTLLAVQAMFPMIGMGARLPEIQKRGAVQPPDVLLMVSALLADVTVTGFAVLGTRRVTLGRAVRRREDDPWPRGLVLAVAPATIWPLLAELALSDVAPMVCQYLGWSRAEAWSSEPGLVRFAVQLGLLLLLTPRAASAAVSPARIAEELKNRGAYVPGVRPGGRTAERIGAIQQRLMVGGVILLGAAMVADGLAAYCWKRLFHQSSVTGEGRWVLIAAALWLTWKSGREILPKDAPPA